MEEKRKPKKRPCRVCRKGGEGTGEGTLVPRQLTMKTLGILQGEGCSKLLQNQRPLL